MTRLWDWQRPVTVREVLEDLSRDHSVAYTTVMTVMNNLHSKGMLARQKQFRAYQYTPTRTREDYSADLIAEVLAGTGDRAAPLLRFMEQLDPAEVAALRAAFDAADTGQQPRPPRRRRT